MIKENINATIGSYSFDGELIVPSMVLTSTPQDEELNLTYTPNFKLKLNDTYGYINENVVNVVFTAGYTDYNAYANVINKSGSYITLQYADGLTYSYNPEPTPPVEVPAYITSYALDHQENFNDSNPRASAKISCKFYFDPETSQPSYCYPILNDNDDPDPTGGHVKFEVKDDNGDVLPLNGDDYNITAYFWDLTLTDGINERTIDNAYMLANGCSINYSYADSYIDILFDQNLVTLDEYVWMKPEFMNVVGIEFVYQTNTVPPVSVSTYTGLMLNCWDAGA